jgi:hypothetical protein
MHSGRYSLSGRRLGDHRSRVTGRLVSGHNIDGAGIVILALAGARFFRIAKFSWFYDIVTADRQTIIVVIGVALGRATSILSDTFELLYGKPA